jgi:L-ascorbate metabolism protein UlaG (beta-lactamase superfamily)
MAERELVLPGGAADAESGSVFFIGNATTIIRYAGFTILTDPNFLHRHEVARLGYGLRSKRLTDPALEIADLPPLDFVLLSHMHEDHFDRVAARDLDKGLPIVTTHHAATALETMGFQAPHELRTWESLSVRKGDARLRITSMPGTHGPGVVGRLLPPVMGSMLEFQPAPGHTALRLYVSGDTLMHDQIRRIRLSYPDIDLALLHLGGTRVLGIYVTMDAAQGVEMIRVLQPKTAIPIHYGEYTVMKSPIEDFQKAVREARFEDRVRYLSHGETYSFRIASSRIA